MWLAALIAVSLTAQVLSQHSYVNQKLQQSGTNLQWGWQLSPLDATVHLDQYFVQPLQQFQFTDVGIFPSYGHLANGITGPAVGYSPAIPNQLYQNPTNNSHSQSNLVQGNVNTPVNLYYVPQQYPVPELQTLQSAPGNLIQYNIPQNAYNSNNPPNAGYNTQTEQPLNLKEAESYQPENSKLQAEKKESISPIVQVFKDHNCSDDTTTAREYSSNIQKSPELSVDLPSYDDSDMSEIFGAKDTSVQSTPKSKIERTRGNTHNEGYFYYSTEVPNAEAERRGEQEGISRLVASTQDLISNDDLIRINHAIEKHVYDISDENIKPLRRNSRIERSGNILGNHITLRAKITKIEDKLIDSDQEKIQQEINESKFTSPIVVQDSTDEDLHEKIVDTLVSTMSPYLDDGYQILSVTQQNDTKTYVPYYKGETVHVTPRPVGQKYLAPITVALRLLNSNHSENFNSIDDHDTSDTELIEETVKSPSKEKTIVEIQQSIPVDITHINEVEYHEYMEEGRSNPNPFDAARNLFNKYMNVFEAERQYEENRQIAEKNYVTEKNDVSRDNENEETKDKLETSENVRSDVRVKNNYNNDYNNKETENYYDKNTNNAKVIQPIVIEKEIQVPQFVDRYIEKPVPYPEPVEVVKHVPVDRPIPVPVPYEMIVERPVEVTKYIDKPFPVPYPVHHKVYVDRPIHVPYPVEKIVEKQVVQTVPVPTPVAVPIKVPIEKPVPYPVEIEKPVPVDRVVEKEVPVPYPVPYEKRVPVTVEKIVEKPVPVHIPVHIYKPIDRVVEKKVPYIVPVDRVVEKKVQVRIPYPIEKVVEKIVEKPVVVTKYIDKPYPVETKVPYIVDNKFPYRIEVPYTNGAHFNDGLKQESQNNAHYLPYQNQQTYNKQNYYPKQNGNLYQGPNSIPVQTTQWGNLYASSFTYLNGTGNNNKAAPSNHLEYVTRNDNYYGPPPMHSYDNMWEKNIHSSYDNTKRNDRTAKGANLRIEYGGFKPPLIPSTEVDLDGRPINKEER